MAESITYTEQELVALLKKRSKEGFSWLYDNYGGALYSVVLSVVPDRELANDTLQEVFVKIWKQIDRYDDSRGRLYTWMMNIARNASIDVIRSKSYKDNKQNRELTDFVHETNASPTINPDKIGLRQIVHKLKKEYRDLIELSYFQGFTQEEISKTLDMPLGTVKTRLRTALIQLRELMKV